MAYKKCVICNEPILNDEDSVPYKGRYAHNKCFNLQLKILTKDKSDKLKQRTSEGKTQVHYKEQKVSIQSPVDDKEALEKKELCDYMKNLLCIDKLNVKILTMIKKYHDTYGFSYLGMKFAFEYYFNVLGNEIDSEKYDYVGLLPYIYDEAQKYILHIKEIQDKNNEIDSSGFYEEEAIIINPKRHDKRELESIEDIL